MMLRLPSFVIVLACMVWPAFAQDEDAQPSFDCAAASETVETLICGDTTLAGLDRTLSESYHTALAARAGEAQAALRDEQRVWAGNRSTACGADSDPAIEVDDAIGCLTALYRARIAELQPGEPAGDGAVSQSGYGWLMGNWNIASIRTLPDDNTRADAAIAQVGRTLRFVEAPIATPSGVACSYPRYNAEPSPGPEFGDLSDYPTAVMVRVSCVGIALLDVVRLTDEKILVGEGEVVFELERRH
ncbi:MAG TPA: lysozyme inhibitor LprI family protein [Dongiaceae bacterium]|nr:lysozyme inhibitor LprI family protein [Dongiaceae bacterium]